MSSGIPWTAAEERILRRLYPSTSTEKIAVKLGRSLVAVKSRAKVLRVKKKRNYHNWTAAEDKILRRLYPNGDTAQLAKKFGTTILSTYQRANKLGVRKSDRFMAKLLKIEAQRLRRVGAASRFRPGQIPPNKGLRMPGWGPGRMKETQFKKGVRPHTWRPLGSTRLMDGYLQRKISDTGYPPDDWVGIHILIWQEAHGSVPQGHAVVFKDKDRTHIVLDNLELISRGELMLRNTVHHLPPELKQVIQLTGALKRKIRNREERLNGKEHIAGSEGSPVCPTGSTERQGESAGS